VMIAALAGRPVGMLIAIAMALGAGLTTPRTIRWRELVVMAVATSAGFTMALFAATAVFPLGPVLAEVKLGALLTAAGSAIALALARILRVGKFAALPSSVAGRHRALVHRAHA
jgi:Na+/H+ antiporter NhaA